MPVTVGSTGSSSSSSFNFFNNTGSNQAMYVAIETTGAVSGVTFNSAPFGWIEDQNFGSFNLEVWRLLNPTQNSSVNMTISHSNSFRYVGIIVFNGVDSVTPEGTPTTNTASSTNSFSLSPSGYVSGDAAFAAFMNLDNTLSVSSSTATQAFQGSGTGSQKVTGLYKTTGYSSGDLAVLASGNDHWAGVAFIVKQLQPRKPRLPLLGCGLLPILRSISLPFSLRKPLEFNLARKFRRNASGLYVPMPGLASM